VSRLVGAVSGVGRRGMLGGLVRSYLDFGFAACSQGGPMTTFMTQSRGQSRGNTQPHDKPFDPESVSRLLVVSRSQGGGSAYKVASSS